MNRDQKQAQVQFLKETFANHGIVLVAHNTGLNVAQMSDLRGRVRAAGAGFKVAKNRLAKIALKDTAYESLTDKFIGPTTITYANDPVSAAKALAEFAKLNDKFVLLGGAFGTTMLDQKGIEALSKLPSLDELRAKIIGLLNAPATKVAGVLQAPAGQLARVFGAYSSKDAA
ncbi:MAG: 50S ribosomal protein L10 [Rickettsiales bacterium]|nr:50S ribosomal protein L10 [Rickettsiales bacterium]